MGANQSNSPRVAARTEGAESHGSAWLAPFRSVRRFRARHPILCFIGGVILLMGLFYAIYMPQWSWDPLGRFLSWNLAKHARWSGGVLSMLGNDITVSGTLVMSPAFSMQIVRGCDALEPAALFLSAVIAFPVGLRKKLLGALLGIVLIEATNVVRMVTLYYVGVYWRNYFEMMHVEVWQAAFIVISVTFWALWALWATRPPKETGYDVAPQPA